MLIPENVKTVVFYSGVAAKSAKWDVMNVHVFKYGVAVIVLLLFHLELAKILNF